MHDQFAVTVATKEDGKEVYKRTLSVYELTAAMHNDEENADTAMANMLEDAINYAIEAQEAFNYTVGAKLGDGSAAPEWTADETHGWNGNVDVAVSLNLKDSIELNVYVVAPDAQATAKLNGETIEIKNTTTESVSLDATKYTRFTIDTIPVVDAMDELTIEIANCGTLIYSIKDYVVQNDSQPNLMAALAKYMQSVADVIGGNNQ